VDLPKGLWPAAKQLEGWSGRLTRESLAGTAVMRCGLQELQEEFYKPQLCRLIWWMACAV